MILIPNRHFALEIPIFRAFKKVVIGFSHFFNARIWARILVFINASVIASSFDIDSSNQHHYYVLSIKYDFLSNPSKIFSLTNSINISTSLITLSNSSRLITIEF